MLLSPGVTAYEALGPYGVFRRAPSTEVVLVADHPGPVPAQGAKVSLVAEAAYRDVELADVVVVPGGIGIRRLVEDRDVLDWVRSLHATSQWTVAVSTGSVLLAAAGGLDGAEATTHWLATDLLEDQGANAVADRLVRSGRVLTATGAVSGIEAALYVVGRVRGTEIADGIRSHLDEALTGAVAANKPLAAPAMAELSGVDAETGDPPPYVLPSHPPRGSSRRARSPRVRRRSRMGSGRIEVIDRSSP